MTAAEQRRAMQAMLFTTEAGRLLERLLCELGHFNSLLLDDRQRIEHNLVVELLVNIGCELYLRPSAIVEAPPPPPSNLIEAELEESEPWGQL